MYPKKIYFIRHGQTEFNKKGILQGGSIDSSLNETGKKQAECFWEAYKNEGFEAIFTSKLKRTHESVQKFIDTGLPWQQFQGLNEISWGIHDGATLDGNSYYWETLELWKKGEVALKTESGESPIDVAERQQLPIAEMKKMEVDKLLVCMHGRALRILISVLMDTPLKEMDQYKHNNLGLWVLDFDGQKFSIDVANEVSHLKGLDSE